MALFADDLIRMLVRTARRELRRRKASRWPCVQGDVVRFRTEDGKWHHQIRPVFDYTYMAGGEQQYGTARGCSYRQAMIDQIADEAEKYTTLKVRYNPADPVENYVFEEDIPGFPFAIDRDPE
jgi:hypothetical protein